MLRTFKMPLVNPSYAETYMSIKVVLVKYHKIKLQTNSWHRDEEPYNNHETPGRQTKQSNQPSLPHQHYCKTRMDTKYRTTKHRTITESHNGRNNQQRINNNRTTALDLQQPKQLGAKLISSYFNILI